MNKFLKIPSLRFDRNPYQRSINFRAYLRINKLIKKKSYRD